MPYLAIQILENFKGQILESMTNDKGQTIKKSKCPPAKGLACLHEAFRRRQVRRAGQSSKFKSMTGPDDKPVANE
jgi:hypothetical protein